MFLTPVMSSGSKIISTILKHDTKATSYKIALLRAINDAVLSFPDLRNRKADVAVPLRLFCTVFSDTASFPGVLSTAVVDLINIFAESRNLARF